MVIASLGPSCQTRFQINRWLAGNPASGAAALSGVFDWQATPLPALLEYLRRDFCGMFEREDLAWFEGRVVHRRFGTSFLHRFPKNIAETDIGKYFVSALHKHEMACERLRLELNEPEVPLLLVVGQALEPAVADEILAIAQRSNPASLTRLLCVDAVGMPSSPPRYGWEGNDAFWDEALDLAVRTR